MQSKSLDYYSAVRSEVANLLDPKADLALDVGCGTGTTSHFLKKSGRICIAHGIEFSEKAAQIADTRLDRVIRFDLNSNEPLDLAKNQYDLVLALDVLEHLVDPWNRIRELGTTLKPGGMMVISVPNVRNFRVVLPLLLLGEFKYAESGLLDSTHLRFFTRKSAIDLAKASELTIEKIVQSGRKAGSITYWANLITFGLLREFFDIQYLVCLRKC